MRNNASSSAAADDDGGGVMTVFVCMSTSALSPPLSPSLKDAQTKPTKKKNP
jgi:hypothetical protein